MEMYWLDAASTSVVRGKLRSCIYVTSRLQPEFAEPEGAPGDALPSIERIEIEHNYCLDHSDTGKLQFQMRVNYDGDEKIQYDIGLRTEILGETAFTFASDDSVNLVERPYYSAEHAISEFGLNFRPYEVPLAINQALCTKGMAASQVEKTIGKSLGVTFSHPVVCTQLGTNIYEILVYRYSHPTEETSTALGEM